MDKELKKKWIEALRSGKYSQGKCCLRSVTGSFCCLGVLADLCEEWEDEAYLGVYHTLSGGAIIYRGPGNELDIDTANTLWNMNDRGDTFDEIADYIEANV